MAKDPPKCLKCQKTLKWPQWTGQKSRPVELDGSRHICDVAPTELEEDDFGDSPIWPTIAETMDKKVVFDTGQGTIPDPTPNKRLAFLDETSEQQVIITELTKQTHLLTEILKEMKESNE